MKTLVLGFDAFDPTIFEQLVEQGKLPNLTKYVAAKGYSRFEVTNPPQSEVSWTSIATGLNPGAHGIFDFVHRDPKSYALNVSLLPTKKGLAGTQFVPPFSAQTIFDYAVDKGFPATALWWPVTFPARLGSPVRTFPGLGTPDIHGRLGVGILFSSEADPFSESHKTAVELLNKQTSNRYTGVLRGPVQKKRRGAQQMSLNLQVDVVSDRSARVTVGKQSVELITGQWSPILSIPFKPNFYLTIRVLTRIILTQIHPEVKLYALPLQLHPLHSPWPYATPRGFVKRTWQQDGPFLTLGWPQDTIGLEDNCISDDQFLDLCDSIFETRQKILFNQLQHFQEGILASVFDSLDRVQHMFWRDRPDVLENWYVKLDVLVGRVTQRLADLNHSQTRVIVVSDHGFADFNYKVHLNRWLIEQGVLTITEPHETGSFKHVNWSQTQAYAIGLNSIYLNLKDREGQGLIQADQKEEIFNKLRDLLLAWRGPDGRPVIQQVWSQAEAFEGPFTNYGPDLVIGFSPGYRASAQTGLGGWAKDTLESNNDHWGADHCIAPQAVPGVIFSNQGLHNFPNPSYRDFPALAIDNYLGSNGSQPPPAFTDEDQKVIEERLESLGYF